MAAVPQPEVTTASIQAIAFGFYSDDEVRESRREGEGTEVFRRRRRRRPPPMVPVHPTADGRASPFARPLSGQSAVSAACLRRKNTSDVCADAKAGKPSLDRRGRGAPSRRKKKHARSAPAFLCLDNPPSLVPPPPFQVRRLSVKRITSPVARDNLGHPVPGGLYDPAMGPLAPGERCGTCGLGGAACAGHFGHVQLAVPVYNPLVFG